MIGYIPNPRFKPQAALYFLDSGDYLFRSYAEGQEASKFVTATDVAAAFSGQEMDTGWLPPGLVRSGHSAGGDWFVYSAPAQKVEIYIGEERLRIPIPRTVLIGIGFSYLLVAQTDKHFDAEGKVYRAPFPNVNMDGRICWGQNTPAEARPERARQVWELFFATPFNADLAGNKSKKYPKDVLLMLRVLGEKKANEYPCGDLEKSGETLERMVERQTAAVCRQR